MGMNEEMKVLCIACKKDCTKYHWLCDLTEGAWCFWCFTKTDCGQGKHGEGCPTQVVER